MNLLHSKESLNSYFIEQIKDYAIFATDTKGIITVWNKGAERIKGYTEAEAIGQYYGILHPDEYQQAGHPQHELEAALQNGSYEAEDWRKRKDGSLFWATVTLTPIFDKKGKHIGFTKITGNITKQKELQDKLAERQQSALEHKNSELQKTNLDLDNFIYTASHDLRSPVTNIEALMLLLKEDLAEANALNDGTEEIVQRVIGSVNRLKHTIEDLTEITRLHKDSEENLSVEIINVQEVYKDILADLNSPGKQKACFMQTDFQVHQLQFSRKNFRSILYNLVSNAIKYQAPERDCIVRIHTHLEEPYVVLRVKDNGLGMTPRQQGQLFTMFKRFHDHVDGTGIGLFMVKRMVENAGGKIEVESEPGTGSEFKVYFRADM
ncbi:sensor histidine kinase [Adhaeribacter rhizoryzae]|uniref:histidine kinase n=1 Tax=Adhaeribacter rhizoryzae TaxID=2607907 RepID=A0A5M6DKM7_9BACT|nr:PAS domain-containing sensor histidine kinase [Adhaeribacter rhizoryzae]KAA5546779.1 PAS domain S-box protein [Adhaeribacter rhizoryzae]